MFQSDQNKKIEKACAAVALGCFIAGMLVIVATILTGCGPTNTPGSGMVHVERITVVPYPNGDTCYYHSWGYFSCVRSCRGY